MNSTCDSGGACTAQFELSTPAHTSKFAAFLAKHLKAPMQIGLQGELGSGKTTFVRLLCEHLGVSSPVSSPTYVLQHIFEGKDLQIEHWDLYRCTFSPEELLDPPQSKLIRLIEWPEKCPEVLQQCQQTLHFEHTFEADNALGRRLSMIGFDSLTLESMLAAWNRK